MPDIAGTRRPLDCSVLFLHSTPRLRSVTHLMSINEKKFLNMKVWYDSGWSRAMPTYSSMLTVRHQLLRQAASAVEARWSWVLFHTYTRQRPASTSATIHAKLPGDEVDPTACGIGTSGSR